MMRDAGAYTVGAEPGFGAGLRGMPRVAFEEGRGGRARRPVEGITARLAAALTRIKSAA